MDRGRVNKVDRTDDREGSREILSVTVSVEKSRLEFGEQREDAERWNYRETGTIESAHTKVRLFVVDRGFLSCNNLALAGGCRPSSFSYKGVSVYRNSCFVQGCVVD